MMATIVPSEHQALGRKAKGFDRKKWDERMLSIVITPAAMLGVLTMND